MLRLASLSSYLRAVSRFCCEAQLILNRKLPLPLFPPPPPPENKLSLK